MSIINGFSTSINSQYFTGETECLRLLWACEQVWGSLNGKRLLEPSVGSGAFIKATKARQLNVQWITNELFPDGNAFEADFNEDFMTLTPDEVGPIDIVIGNPPYSGNVQWKGKKQPLGWAFVLHALTFADRVAMVLTPKCLRAVMLSALPSDVGVVAYTEPSNATYNLGGSGGGEDKDVNTSIVLFERMSSFQNDYALLSGEIDGIELLPKNQTDKATHMLQMWGGSNARAVDGSWGRQIPYAIEIPLEVTTPEAEALLASGVVGKTPAHFTATSSMTNDEEMKHLILYAQTHTEREK
ncbi:Eco57I restriction-modification methylase domain-containing protein [bacterium]|nr:Eco57I restriction-modification methylase domain-containing protein [bacterium]